MRRRIALGLLALAAAGAILLGASRRTSLGWEIELLTLLVAIPLVAGALWYRHRHLQRQLQQLEPRWEEPKRR